MKSYKLSTLAAALIVLCGCDTTADEPVKNAAAKPTAGPAPTGGDYLSTAFRARSRAQEQLGKVAAERATQVREEKEFSETPKKEEVKSDEPAL